jgi:DNA-binding GntR family transcriptional regulator
MRPVDRPRSLTEIVLARLRASIVSGDFDLGAPLSERQLSLSLNVSKTPVREALAQLRLEGLVRIYPQRGAFVFTLSAREVMDLCELRLTLEVAALKLAFARNAAALVKGLSASTQRMEKARAAGDLKDYLVADTAYHQVLFDQCGNPLIAEAHGMHSGKIAALRNHLAAKPKHTELSFGEHVEMRDLLATGRIDETLAVLNRHIERTKATYATWIEDIAAADRSAGAA